MESLCVLKEFLRTPSRGVSQPSLADVLADMLGIEMLLISGFNLREVRLLVVAIGFDAKRLSTGRASHSRRSRLDHMGLVFT